MSGQLRLGKLSMTSDQQTVLKANADFYAAFSNRDFSRMERLWSEADHIIVIHPGWPALIGRRPVISSWKRIMEGGMSPEVSCVDAQATILGETAVVVCTEILTDTELVATNIFCREEDEWKLIHHHSGPLPQLNHAAGEEHVH